MTEENLPKTLFVEFRPPFFKTFVPTELEVEQVFSQQKNSFYEPTYGKMLAMSFRREEIEDDKDQVIELDYQLDMMYKEDIRQKMQKSITPDDTMVRALYRKEQIGRIYEQEMPVYVYGVNGSLPTYKREKVFLIIFSDGTAYYTATSEDNRKVYNELKDEAGW
jgi:hypothetical protein